MDLLFQSKQSGETNSIHTNPGFVFIKFTYHLVILVVRAIATVELIQNGTLNRATPSYRFQRGQPTTTTTGELVFHFSHVQD